eukprot:scaffold2822_cov100-Isochrysis_galbana.AAC.7
MTTVSPAIELAAGRKSGVLGLSSLTPAAPMAAAAPPARRLRLEKSGEAAGAALSRMIGAGLRRSARAPTVRATTNRLRMARRTRRFPEGSFWKVRLRDLR